MDGARVVGIIKIKFLEFSRRHALCDAMLLGVVNVRIEPRG